jgi:hypothetical protein
MPLSVNIGQFGSGLFALLFTPGSWIRGSETDIRGPTIFPAPDGPDGSDLGLFGRP